MLKRRSKLEHGLTLLKSAIPSIGGFVRGLWARGDRALIPLVIFLALTGLVLIFAASVEALAPFIYTIF